MLRVALTGGIATGKSYVLARLSAAGVPTIDADAIVHDALATGSPVVPRIASKFGSAVMRADGSVDRATLASIVFADADARADLEAILHPYVYAEIDRWFRSLPSRPEGSSSNPRNYPFAVADIPLLYETHHEGLFDRVIVTACKPARQIARVMERDGASEDEARRRLAAQWPIEEKVRRADYVIDTGGTFEETDEQVEAVLRDLREKARDL